MDIHIKKFEELFDRNVALIDEYQNEIEVAEEELGKEIKKFRTSKKIALRPFAEKLKISHAYLDDIENGRRGITSTVIEKLKSLTLIEYKKCLKKSCKTTMSQGKGKVPKYCPEHNSKNNLI